MYRLPSILPLQASINHPYLSDHVNYVFSPIHNVLVIILWHTKEGHTGSSSRSRAAWYIAQLSPGISNLITELIAIGNLTSVRFYSVWFSRKKVCLHLLHVENDRVEFSAVHKLFNKDGSFGPSFQTIFPLAIIWIIASNATSPRCIIYRRKRLFLWFRYKWFSSKVKQNGKVKFICFNFPLHFLKNWMIPAIKFLLFILNFSRCCM